MSDVAQQRDAADGERGTVDGAPLAPSWRVLAAGVTGEAHARGGRGREDAHTWHSLPDGTLVLAVADGAGSAAHAADGARAAVMAAVATVLRARRPSDDDGAEAWQRLLRRAFRAARAVLQRRALATDSPGRGSAPLELRTALAAGGAVEVSRGRYVLAEQPVAARLCGHASALVPTDVTAVYNSSQEPGERSSLVSAPRGMASEEGMARQRALDRFATTLLLVVARGDWLAAAQIGDGAIVIQGEDGGLRLLFEPEHGEYVNETAFLTAPNFLDRLHCATLHGVAATGMALLTDGLELLAIDMAQRRPHAGFFGPLFAFARQPDATPSELAAFLGSERIRARTDDDRTLLLAVRPCNPCNVPADSR